MMRSLHGCVAVVSMLLAGMVQAGAQVPGLGAPMVPGGGATGGVPGAVGGSGAVPGLPIVREGSTPRLQADPHNTFGNSLLLEAEMERELMKARADTAEQRRRLRELESSTKPQGSAAGSGPAAPAVPVAAANFPVVKVQPSIVGVVSGDGGYRVMLRHADGRLLSYGPGEKLPDGRVISNVTAQQVSFQRGPSVTVPNTGAVGR